MRLAGAEILPSPSTTDGVEAGGRPRRGKAKEEEEEERTPHLILCRQHAEDRREITAAVTLRHWAHCNCQCGVWLDKQTQHHWFPLTRRSNSDVVQ